jgi:uncharacterized membrane-anchored protein YhcB (DUF1043 family)
MWLIFIVVVLVLAILMVFLMLAIRMLTGQAKEQLNRYFLKNLETYDRLAENKSKEIDELQGTLADLTDRVASKQRRLNEMAETAQSVTQHTEPVGTVAATADAGALSDATYRDPGFLDDYAYVRQNMKLDYKGLANDLLGSLDYSESDEARLCRSMLEKLPADRLYDIVTMQDNDQIEYLSSLFNEEEEAYLGDYTAEHGKFDLLNFHNYITNYVKDHESHVYIRTGNPEDFADLIRENVSVLFDPGIHEGIRISFKNTVYDYSL